MILHIRTKICKVLKNRNIIKLHGGTFSFRPEEDDLKDSESFSPTKYFLFLITLQNFVLISNIIQWNEKKYLNLLAKSLGRRSSSCLEISIEYNIEDL